MEDFMPSVETKTQAETTTVGQAGAETAAETDNRPCVLTFSASDSAGLAGMHMDIKTQQALGVHCLSVVTAVTAQNNQAVIAVEPVSSALFGQQISANEAFHAAVIKTGLIAGLEQMAAIKQLKQQKNIPLVCDPVLSASAGDEFHQQVFISCFKDQFLAECDLLTPNIGEAEKLTNSPIHCKADMQSAAHTLVELGAKAVLIKGGHSVNESVDNNVDMGAGKGERRGGDSEELCQDYFYSPSARFWLSSPYQHSENKRGTGCALASAIAAALALGFAMQDAVIIGKMCINQGLRQAYSLGLNQGCVNVRDFPHKQQDLPYLTDHYEFPPPEPFPPCADTALGFYPIVDRAAWLERLLPLGVSTIQLRIKDLSGAALEQEIEQAVAIAKRWHCRLFINDHWQQALKYQAYGVHLGQEDLASADIQAIHHGGLRLGISSHCHAEVARAHSYRPSYLAWGPVFATTTKIMPWIPQGISTLQYWQSMLDYPLVAIGGINSQRMAGVVNTGVSGVAVISAISAASEPEEATAELLNMLSKP